MIVENKWLADNDISNDKWIVCHCSSGGRASHTFIALKIAGFQNVRLYDDSNRLGKQKTAYRALALYRTF